jgi:hypothetical protein
MGALKSPVCARGHKMAGENLHIAPNGRRVCRACQTIRAREYRKRRKAQAK